MQAKTYLKQIKKLNTLIENKKIEIEQLQAAAEGASSSLFSERVQTSVNPDRMANAIGKYIELEKELEKRLQELISVRQEIISTIEQLDTVEYDTLHMIYVQNLTFYDVSAKYDKSYSWSTTIHGRALKSVQKILDKREETNK
jgi:uncharacterized protein YukE